MSKKSSTFAPAFSTEGACLSGLTLSIEATRKRALATLAQLVEQRIRNA